MPVILVTNDDGVTSPGLHALADALKPLGDVTVVAPTQEASAIGHALTLRRPLRIEPVPGQAAALVPVLVQVAPRLGRGGPLGTYETEGSGSLTFGFRPETVPPGVHELVLRVAQPGGFEAVQTVTIVVEDE